MGKAFWMRIARSGRLASAMAVAGTLVTGCATTGTMPDGKNITAAPANYRQVIAAEIRTWDDAAEIRSGLITRPHPRWLGLINGGTRDAVCVTLIKPLLFGNIGPAPYMFFFENGKPDYYRQGKTSPYSQVGCGDEPMLPFTELDSPKAAAASPSKGKIKASSR
jgi:hypothetical protein